MSSLSKAKTISSKAFFSHFLQIFQYNHYYSPVFYNMHTAIILSFFFQYQINSIILTCISFDSKFITLFNTAILSISLMDIFQEISSKPQQILQQSCIIHSIFQNSLFFSPIVTVYVLILVGGLGFNYSRE